MTPETAREKKMEVKKADFAGHCLLRNSPKFKRRGSWMTPKAARNPKLGVIFAKCAPMTPWPPLALPLIPTPLPCLPTTSPIWKAPFDHNTSCIIPTHTPLFQKPPTHPSTHHATSPYLTPSPSLLPTLTCLASPIYIADKIINDWRPTSTYTPPSQLNTHLSWKPCIVDKIIQEWQHSGHLWWEFSSLATEKGMNKTPKWT